MLFGDYAPFLEISVAINLLLAVWAALWQRVGKAVIQLRNKWFRAMKSVADNVGTAAKLQPPPAPLMERGDALDAMSRRMPFAAKVAAAGVVTLIALALFLVNPESRVTPTATYLIAASALAQPSLMLLLVTVTFIRYTYTTWVPYRLFRRRAIKTIEEFSSPALDSPAGESAELQRSDEGLVCDSTGSPVAAIHHVTEDKVVILVLADVFGSDLDITHDTPESAMQALCAEYMPSSLAGGPKAPERDLPNHRP